MPRLTFFIGKGGVGKTTVSSAYAAHLAATSRQPVLLMSTDPAHSLADVLEIKLGDAPKPLNFSRGKLTVWQVPAEKEFHRFLGKYREAILRLIEQNTIFTGDEISPLLETAAPGMAEVAGLLAMSKALDNGDYQHIVVDTAPLGHTLRLFQMPAGFARFLAFLEVAASHDEVLAETFGGHVAPAGNRLLRDWTRLAEDLDRTLRGRQTEIVLVTTAENFALSESLRARSELRAGEFPLAIGRIVLNRLVTQPGACASCRRRASKGKKARALLQREFPGAPIHQGEDPGGPILGLKALADFGRHVFTGAALKLSPRVAASPELPREKIDWPTLETHLTFTTGKGGVGKTTISAGLAYNSRRRRRARPVWICSTDPAPSLDDIFRQPVGDEPQPVLGDRRLIALEIDAMSGFRGWAEGIKARIDGALSAEVRGVHVELSFEGRLIKALLDIVPPGIDELMATFRLLELAGKEDRHLVVDMAPTGHALEMLKTPARVQQWSRLLLKSLAPHRKLALAQEAAVQIAFVGQRARELGELMRDGGRSRLFPVMLAEPLPDRETERLLAELDGLGLALAPLFVNRLVPKVRASRCGRCANLRHWQILTLAQLRRRYPERDILAVEDLAEEVSGRKGLQALTHQLWRLK